jgi:hypothetical protein
MDGWDGPHTPGCAFTQGHHALPTLPPIDVQKARDPLARYGTWFFSTTRARHDTDLSGPGLSPAQRAYQAQQEFESIGLARARPVNRPVHRTPNGSTNNGLHPNGPNSALRSRTPAVPPAPFYLVHEQRHRGNPNPNPLSLLRPLRAAAPGSSSSAQSLSLLCAAPVLRCSRSVRGCLRCSLLLLRLESSGTLWSLLPA